MSKKKGLISVYDATFKAWTDEIEQCEKNGIKPIIHYSTFIDRVRAYVNGGSKDGFQMANAYKPLDSNIHRRMQELRTDGKIDYDYDKQKEYYIIKPIKTKTA